MHCTNRFRVSHPENKKACNQVWVLLNKFPRSVIFHGPLTSDPGVTHVSWCMSGLLTRGDGKNVPGIPGTCTTLNFSYLGRGPFLKHWLPNEFHVYTRLVSPPRPFVWPHYVNKTILPQEPITCCPVKQTACGHWLNHIATYSAPSCHWSRTQNSSLPVAWSQDFLLVPNAITSAIVVSIRTVSRHWSKYMCAVIEHISTIMSVSRVSGKKVCCTKIWLIYKVAAKKVIQFPPLDGFFIMVFPPVLSSEMQ